MSRTPREGGSESMHMGNAVLLAHVRHVRSLLARLRQPDAPLWRLAGDAEAHLRVLTPQFAALEVDPFAGLPAVAYEQPVEGDDAPAPVRREVEPPLPPPRPATSLEAAAEPLRSANPARAGEVAPKGQHGVRGAVLPLSPRRRSRATAAGSAGSRAHALGAIEPPAPPAAAARADAAGPPAVAANVVSVSVENAGVVAQPMDLGALAARVLAQVAAEKARTAPAGPGTRDRLTRAAPRSASGPAAEAALRGATLRPAVPRSVARDRRAGNVPSADASPRAALLPSLPDAARPVAAPLAAPVDGAAREPGFYFDPLAPRAAVADEEELLAERVARVLHEQARRQGVDLT